MTAKFCFLDLETTGLETDSDVVLEIGAIATDADLNVLSIFQVVANWDRIEYDIQRDEYSPPFGVHKIVVEMHQRNGLWEESYRSNVGLWEAVSRFMEWAENWCSKDETHLAGSSVWFDRDFLNRQSFPFEQLLHYRQVDVSGIKTLYKLWVQQEEADKPDFKTETHRAVADCHESIQELKWYRKKLFNAGIGS